MSNMEDTQLQTFVDNPLSSTSTTTTTTTTSTNKIYYTPDELIALEGHAVLPKDSNLPDRSFYRFDAPVVMKMNNYIHNANNANGNKKNYKKNYNGYNSRQKDHNQYNSYSYNHGNNTEEDDNETPAWMAETDFKVDPDFQLYMKSGSHTTDEFEREKKIFLSKRNNGITKEEVNDDAIEGSVENFNHNNDDLKKELLKQLEEPEILGPTEQEYYQNLSKEEKATQNVPTPRIKANAGDFQFGLEFESKKEKDNDFFNSLLSKSTQDSSIPTTKSTESTVSTPSFSSPPVIQRTGSQILPPGLASSISTDRSLTERSGSQQSTSIPPEIINSNGSNQNFQNIQNFPNQSTQMTPDMQLQKMKQIQMMQQMQQMQQLQQLQQLQRQKQQQQQQQQQGGENNTQNVSTIQNLPNFQQQINTGLPHSNLNQIPPHLLQHLINSNQHSPQLPPGITPTLVTRTNTDSNIVPQQRTGSPQETRQQVQNPIQLDQQMQQHMQQQMQQQMQNMPPHLQLQLQQQMQHKMQQHQLQQMQQQQPNQMSMPMPPMSLPMSGHIPTGAFPHPDQLPPPLREKFYQIQQALVHFQRNGQQPPPILLHDMMELNKVIQNNFGRLGHHENKNTPTQPPA